MQFDWSTFALQTVNFVILVWLLQRFLYKPVLRIVDARRTEIDNQYAAARTAGTKAEEQLAALEKERAGIKAERAVALKQAAAEAEQSAASRRVQAEREAAALLAEARKTLAAEREQALVEARHAALDLAVEIASRLLAEIPAPLRAEAWLGRIEKHLATMPVLEKAALSAQLTNGASLQILTATALPADMAAQWRSRLQRSLGDHVAVDFSVEPKLVDGVELHFPNAILRFSWQDALRSITAAIEPHADAG